MDNTLFVEWLENERNMSTRSARDVSSRLKRASDIIGKQKIDSDSLEELNNDPAFAEKSIFVKSQLRRSITLYLEYSSAR